MKTTNHNKHLLTDSNLASHFREVIKNQNKFLTAILNKKNSKDYLVEKKNFKTEEPEVVSLLNIEA